jgi:diguanylate cyclase (GGDEF)-like protein
VFTFPPGSGQPIPARRLLPQVCGASVGTTSTSSFLALALLSAGLRIYVLRRQLRRALYETRHDKLTGLPNRHAALTRLHAEPVGLVGLLDLDGFKDVNDRYGHDIGDGLLSGLATRLQRALGQDGMVARLAGDEFLVLWTERPNDPLAEAERVLREALRPLLIQGRLVEPAGSLGLALPGPHLANESLLAAADHAMYEAKDGAGIHLYAADTPPGPVDRATPAGRRCARQRHRARPSA